MRHVQLAMGKVQLTSVYGGALEQSAEAIVTEVSGAPPCVCTDEYVYPSVLLPCLHQCRRCSQNLGCLRARVCPIFLPSFFSRALGALARAQQARRRPMPDLRSGKRGAETSPCRAALRRRLNEHGPETARLLSRAERASRRAESAEAAAPPLPDVCEQLAAEVAARKSAEQKARAEAVARRSAEQSAASTYESLSAERFQNHCRTLQLQRLIDDLRQRLSTESSMRLNAERQLSAVEGFEFEDGYWGSGNWKPFLDQNAVQSLRMLQVSNTHRYTIGTNIYDATMQFNGEISQRNVHYGTQRRVRKTGTQPWQPALALGTARWLTLAGSWNTEQAVRELFERRCQHTLQVESVTAVHHGASLNAFSAGNLGGDADPPIAHSYSQCQTDALLFHGTNEANVANIMAGGLKLKFAKAGMLGAGIYGAPDPRKANQYVPAGQHGRFMFLCRFNTIGGRIHQNVLFTEYCVYDESKVVVLWMLKVR